VVSFYIPDRYAELIENKEKAVRRHVKVYIERFTGDGLEISKQQGVGLLVLHQYVGLIRAQGCRRYMRYQRVEATLLDRIFQAGNPEVRRELKKCMSCFHNQV